MSRTLCKQKNQTFATLHKAGHLCSPADSCSLSPPISIESRRWSRQHVELITPQYSVWEFWWTLIPRGLKHSDKTKAQLSRVGTHAARRHFSRMPTAPFSDRCVGFHSEHIWTFGKGIAMRGGREEEGPMWPVIYQWHHGCGNLWTHPTCEQADRQTWLPSNNFVYGWKFYFICKTFPKNNIPFLIIFIFIFKILRQWLQYMFELD